MVRTKHHTCASSAPTETNTRRHGTIHHAMIIIPPHAFASHAAARPTGPSHPPRFSSARTNFCPLRRRTHVRTCVQPPAHAPTRMQFPLPIALCVTTTTQSRRRAARRGTQRSPGAQGRATRPAKACQKSPPPCVPRYGVGVRGAVFTGAPHLHINDAILTDPGVLRACVRRGEVCGEGTVRSMPPERGLQRWGGEGTRPGTFSSHHTQAEQAFIATAMTHQGWDRYLT